MAAATKTNLVQKQVQKESYKCWKQHVRNVKTRVKIRDGGQTRN